MASESGQMKRDVSTAFAGDSIHIACEFHRGCWREVWPKITRGLSLTVIGNATGRLSKMAGFDARRFDETRRSPLGVCVGRGAEQQFTLREIDFHPGR